MSVNFVWKLNCYVITVTHARFYDKCVNVWNALFRIPFEIPMKSVHWQKKVLYHKISRWIFSGVRVQGSVLHIAICQCVCILFHIFVFWMPSFINFDLKHTQPHLVTRTNTIKLSSNDKMRILHSKILATHTHTHEFTVSDYINCTNFSSCRKSKWLVAGGVYIVCLTFTDMRNW